MENQFNSTISVNSMSNLQNSQLWGIALLSVAVGLIGLLNLINKHSESDFRNILFIKGFTHGLSAEKLIEAVELIKKTITERNITTIVWDGDLNVYPDDDGVTAKSFTALFDILNSMDSRLEFMPFKKQSSVHKLLSNAPTKVDKYGVKLGPYRFLAEGTNTVVIEPGDSFPLRTRDRNVVVGLADSPEYSNNYAKFGVDVMAWVKKNTGISTADLVIVGCGETVTKELELMNDSNVTLGKSSPYPQLRIHEIESQR